MRLHRDIEDGLARVAGGWPELPQAARMPDRLPRAVAEFCGRDANRDGRGLRPDARKTVTRTLGYVRSAGRVVSDPGAPGDLADSARGLLKSLSHDRDFGVTVERARRFAGERRKAGRRRKLAAAEVRRRECACGTIAGAGEVRLRGVVSAEELARVGRRLALCVGGSAGRGYLRDLRERVAEFWTLDGPSGPFALLRVDGGPGERMVTECAGYGNSEPEAVDGNGRRHALPRRILRGALRFLDADAPEVGCFGRAGVFRSLLDASVRDAFTEVTAGGARYRVWRFPDEFIMVSGYRGDADLPAPGERWSRFVRGRDERCRRRRRDGWREGTWHDGAMDVCELLELLADSPGLYAAFAGTGGTPRERVAGRFRTAAGPDPSGTDGDPVGPD